jgi:uncharacterized protein (TIGR03086 family)
MTLVSPPRPVAVLDSAVVWTRDRLHAARRSPLTLPTPCSEWDLGDLLAHMEDSLTTLAEAARLGHVDLAAGRAPLDRAHVVDRVLRRACTARAAWLDRVTSAPVTVDELPLGHDTVVLVGALEIAVHGWDVAQATGERCPLPEDLAARLLGVARAVVTPTERGPRFGPAVAVEPSASAGARLLAHLGRDAAWTRRG